MADFFFQLIPDIIWSLAAFVVFVLILLRFGLRPVVRAIEARDSRIREDLAASERDRHNAESLRQEVERRLDGIGDEVERLLAKGRQEAEQLRQAIIEEGHQQVEKMHARAVREIEAAHHRSLVGMQAEIADIATMVVGRILARQLDPAAHQDLVAAAIDEIEASLVDHQVPVS